MSVKIAYEHHNDEWILSSWSPDTKDTKMVEIKITNHTDYNCLGYKTYSGDELDDSCFNQSTFLPSCFKTGVKEDCPDTFSVKLDAFKGIEFHKTHVFM